MLQNQGEIERHLSGALLIDLALSSIIASFFQKNAANRIGIILA